MQFDEADDNTKVVLKRPAKAAEWGEVCVCVRVHVWVCECVGYICCCSVK